MIYTVDKYVYLGITLTESLNYDVTAKVVAQSAGRALGLLIAKYRSIGGMPYDVFTKLFETLVWPVISYGASIWGFKSYTCINAVQNRALRFYLGTEKPLSPVIWGGSLHLLNSGRVFVTTGIDI